MIKINTSEKASEIIMGQYPTWFKPILEYIAIAKAFGFSIAGLELAALKIQQNFFIQTADEDTIAEYEKLFQMVVDPSATLEERRAEVLSRLAQKVPYTVWNLKERLTELFGTAYTLEVDEAACTIKIFVTSSRYGAVDLVKQLILDWVPAHLYVYTTQQVKNDIPGSVYVASRFSHTHIQTIKGGA